MRGSEQRQSDRLIRVQGFIGAHADVLGAIKDLDGRKQIDAAVSAIIAHVDNQGTADRYIAGQMARQRALAEELIKKHMKPIATFARAKLANVPEFAALTQAVSDGAVAPLIRAARSMAVAAEKYSDMLTAGGLPQAAAQINALVDALTDARTQRANLRVERVGFTEGIEENLRLGKEGVKLLDAAISRQFASDKTLLASWRSASRVEAKSGSVRTTAQPVQTQATANGPVAAGTTVMPNATTASGGAVPPVATPIPPVASS
jgi:hypothetical protein